MKENTIKFVSKEEIGTLPKILYKYRTWSKDDHKRLLTHSEIYFASPDEFNEVTECNLERDYDCITEEMIWEFCRNEAMRQASLGEIPIPFINNRTKELYCANQFHNQANRQETKEFMKAHLNQTLSIFSASEFSDNERLWNTFASNKRGYCVGIDFTEIYADNDTFGSCSRIHYYDEIDPPKIPAFSLSQDEQVMNMLSVIYSLPKKFEAEQEFRLSKVNIPNRQVSIYPEWIKEIILGSEMTETDKNEIISIAREKYPHAKLKRLFVEPTYGVLSIIDL